MVDIRLILILLASVSLVIWSVCWTLADLYTSRGIDAFFEKRYLAGEKNPEERAMDLLSTASTLNPMSPDIWYRRARFTYLLGFADDPTSDIAVQRRNLSTNLFIRALQLRPHSGRLWARYAKHSLKLDAPIQETLNKLEIALAFAPFEYKVRKAEIMIGLALWDELEEAKRERLLSSVRFLLRLDPRYVIKIAVAADWSNNLRPLLKRKWHIRHLESMLAKKAKRAKKVEKAKNKTAES